MIHVHDVGSCNAKALCIHNSLEIFGVQKMDSACTWMHSREKIAKVVCFDKAMVHPQKCYDEWPL